jgi:hypothetical protein
LLGPGSSLALAPTREIETSNESGLDLVLLNLQMSPTSKLFSFTNNNQPVYTIERLRTESNFIVTFQVSAATLNITVPSNPLKYSLENLIGMYCFSSWFIRDIN